MLFATQYLQVQLPSWVQDHHTTSNTTALTVDEIILTGELRVVSSLSPNAQTQRERHLADNGPLSIRIYDVTSKRNKQRLKTYSQQHPISMIVENNKYRQYGNDFKKLQEELAWHDITLLPDEHLWVNFTHAKTFVGDTNWVIQTANLSNSAFRTNREHFVLWNDPLVRDNLYQLYQLDQQVITTRKSVSYQPLLDNLSPSLVICPLNCRDVIESAIKNAQESIYFSAQYVSDHTVLRLLQQQSHLDLRIRTNAFDSNNDLVKLFGKKNIIFENNKVYNHDKLMIIDNQIMLIGSMNFSQNALDNNREIGILITDPTLIRDRVRALFSL